MSTNRVVPSGQWRDTASSASTAARVGLELDADSGHYTIEETTHPDLLFDLDASSGHVGTAASPASERKAATLGGRAFVYES